MAYSLRKTVTQGHLSLVCHLPHLTGCSHPCSHVSYLPEMMICLSALWRFPSVSVTAPALSAFPFCILVACYFVKSWGSCCSRFLPWALHSPGDSPNVLPGAAHDKHVTDDLFIVLSNPGLSRIRCVGTCCRHSRGHEASPSFLVYPGHFHPSSLMVGAILPGASQLSHFYVLLPLKYLTVW